MELSEREAFSKMLIAIGQIYGKTISPLMVKLYWQVLAAYLFPEVLRALETHVQDPDVGQFMPKPADVIRVLKGDSQSQSLQAWSKVEGAIQQVGPYRSVAFDDPTIHAVLQEMGGWIKICQTSEKELPFVTKEFQTRFNAYRHQPARGYPQYFAGINEHQNCLQGYSAEEIVLLGDQTKAQALLSKETQEENVVTVASLISPSTVNEESYARTTTTVC